MTHAEQARRGAPAFQERNTGPGEILLWLEPWAEEFPIPVGSLVELFIRGVDDPALDVERTATQIIVYAPDNAYLEVRIDDVLQDSISATIPVPDTNGLGSRAFVGLVFGNFPEARPGGAIHQDSETPNLRARLKRFFGL